MSHRAYKIETEDTLSVDPGDIMRLVLDRGMNNPIGPFNGQFRATNQSRFPKLINESTLGLSYYSRVGVI